MPRKAGFRHHMDTRNAIQAKALINRLHKHATSDEPIMDASQVNAAKALLNKVLPDLSAVSHAGDESGVPIKHEIEVRIIDPGTGAST